MFDNLKRILSATLVVIGYKKPEPRDPFRNSPDAAQHYEITSERIGVDSVMRKTDEIIMISNMGNPAGPFDTDLIDSGSTTVHRVMGVPATLREAVASDFTRTMDELDGRV